MKLPNFKNWFKKNQILTENKQIKTKFSDEIMNDALYLMDGSISYRKIALMIKEKYNVEISIHTLSTWHSKLKSNVQMIQHRPLDYESKRLISIKNEYNTWKRHKEKQIGSINATY